jgi:hypothetical protein
MCYSTRGSQHTYYAPAFALLTSNAGIQRGLSDQETAINPCMRTALRRSLFLMSGEEAGVMLLKFAAVQAVHAIPNAKRHIRLATIG